MLALGLFTTTLWLAPVASGYAAAPEAGTPVSEVLFVAPENINTEKLQRFVEVRKGDPFSRRNVRRSLELLEKLGEFSEVEAFAEETDDGVAVTFKLTPRPRLDEILVKGNEVLKKRRILRRINRKSGSPIEEADAEQIAKTVQAGYHRLGYLKVQVDVDIVAVSPGYVNAEVQISEGRQYLVSEVKFLGDLNPDFEEALPKVVGLRPGEPFAPATLDRDVRRIMRYHRDRYFLEASTRPPIPIPNEENATVRVLFFVDSGERVDIQFNGRSPKFGELLARNITAPVSFRRSKLLDILDIENETQFTQGFTEQGELLLTQYYQESGYYEVQVKGELLPVDFAGRVKPIRFTIVPGRRYKLEADGIVFDGSTSFRFGTLRQEYIDGAPAVLGNKGYSDSAAELARLRVENFYKSQGFESARVGREPRTNMPVPPDVEADPRRRRLTVRVRVEEGPRTHIESIVFSGNQTVTEEALQGWARPLGSRATEPLDAYLVLETEKKIEAQYGNRGRPDAKVRAKRLEGTAANNVVLEFEIDEGPLVHFGKVITPDTALTQPDVVRDQISIRPGDPWDGRSLQRTRRKLQRLGVFDRVEVAAFSDSERLEGPSAGANDGALLRDVRVVLLESNRVVFEPSVGLSSEKGPRAVVRLVHRNLPPGRAHKLSLRFEANWRWEGFIESDGSFRRFNEINDKELEYRVLAAYGLPTLFGSAWAGNLTGVFGETDQRRTFGVRRNQLALTVNRDLGRAWHFVGQYSLGVRTILNKGYSVVHERDFGDQPLQFRSAEVGADVILDRRDDRFNPRRGWLTRLDTVVADRVLGGEFSYVRVAAGASAYLPLNHSKSVYMVLGAKGGWAIPFGDTQGLPVDQRFHVGGTATLRGFTEESVGPQLAIVCDPNLFECDASPGGDLYGTYSVELRFPLPLDLGGVVFHDGGNAWLLNSGTLDEIRNPRTLEGAVGLGFRIGTPVGPAKLDYAIPVRNFRGTEAFLSTGRFHITIGDF